jgi:hypothetical protein
LIGSKKQYDETAHKKTMTSLVPDPENDLSKVEIDEKIHKDERALRYGLHALATIVFDVDSGHKLDALYPENCGFSDQVKKSIAHLALPHSNKQDEGDTQFVVRFPCSKQISK